jgi:glycosyltransferase involved in cell wall biosynthesis
MTYTALENTRLVKDFDNHDRIRVKYYEQCMVLCIGANGDMPSEGRKLSLCIVASSVGKTPEEVTYSFVYDEVVRLVKRGMEVHVSRFKFEGSGRSSGIYFHDVRRKFEPAIMWWSAKSLYYHPLISLSVNPKKMYKELLYSYNISKIVKKINPDIVHAHFAYPEGWAAYIAIKSLKRRIPFVVTLHGYDILLEPQVGYGIRLNKYHDFLARKVINEADAVIVASRAVRNEAEKIMKDPQKIHLIHNAVDLQRFNPLIDGSRVRRLYNAEDKFVVFTLRGHEPVYGIAYLILAAKIVLRHRKDVVFILGGDGSLKEYHVKLTKRLGIDDHIFFPGKIPRKEVPSYYAASDIVVAPSLQEAWGLVVTEAMACGKPVVASKVGGLLDQVIEGFNGFLVPPRDPKVLADRILYLLENPFEARKMGLNGRKLAEEKFDIEKRVDKIVELYRTLVEGAR